MDEIIKYWPVVAFVVSLAIGGIVWNIRLEGKVNMIERTQTTEIARMGQTLMKLEDGMSEIRKDLKDVAVSIATIMGYEKGAASRRAK